MLGTSKYDVDFASVFAVLSSQFEASCQLQAARKHIKSSTEGNPAPVSGWLEYSKKLQWRRSTASSPEPSVPDFERMKDDSAETISSVAQSRDVSSDELYDKWLMPQEDAQNAATISSARLSTSHNESNADEATNGKVNSDSSSVGLLHSSSDHGVSVKQHGHFNADTSPWLLQPSLSIKEDKLLVSLELDWLNPGKKIENHQTCFTAKTNDSQQHDLPQQGNSCMEDSNEQQPLPRGIRLRSIQYFVICSYFFRLFIFE